VGNRAFAKAVRVIGAFVGGVLFSYLCSWEAVYAGAYLMNAFLITSLTEGNDLIYRGKLGDVYVQFAWLGVILAAGASFALFALEPIGKRRLSVAWYAILLLLLMPLSVANYISIDLWTVRVRQGICDIVLVLLGLTAISRLVTYQVSSILARITRAAAIFLLGTASVMIPVAYALIWLLNKNHLAKTADQVTGFQPSWISAIAAVVSAGFAVSTLRFSREARG
jgi:predicted small integral membrane protein